jgi:hypothetical protein
MSENKLIIYFLHNGDHGGIDDLYLSRRYKVESEAVRLPQMSATCYIFMINYEKHKLLKTASSLLFTSFIM